MAKPRRHNDCTVIRTMLLKHSVLSLATGEVQPTGEEWVTRPCGVPLFGDAERARGTCRGCAGGFNHPDNYRADGPRPRSTTER